MKRIVFLGPSLPIEAAKAELDAIYLPPVSQGDIYRAIRQQPTQIGIVDGYFDFVPAVWHKEILSALSLGIRVFGSASMGALRAAELWQFGMEGIGQIFENFRDGLFEDDDEVALVHGPQELGYSLLSEPMVNIRATLDRAQEVLVISGEARTALIGLAKSLFYVERTWPNLMARAKTDVVPAAELSALATFLPEGRVDRKRLDALDMLRAMGDARPAPQPANFRLEETWLSEEARRISISHSNGAHRDPLVETLRSHPSNWRSLYRSALFAFALKSEARRQDIVVSEDEVAMGLRHFCHKHGLVSASEVDEWLARNELNSASLVRLIREDLQIKAMKKCSDPLVEAELLSQLKLSGRYSRLD